MNNLNYGEMDAKTHIERDMVSLGCRDHTKIALALRLYLYLVDVQRAHDVEYCYSAEIDEIYCLARAGKGEKVRLYLPRQTCKTLSMKDIKDLQLQLCTVETGASINIAFIESDTTLVIYNFQSDLPDMTAPSTSARRSRMLRRHLIDGELRSRVEEFAEEVTSGVNLDDDDVVMIT